MIFNGISRVFSTINDEQYDTIGEFWDEMSKIYGMENLRGLGYSWKNNTIEYAIGLKHGIIENSNININLPDDKWETIKGDTENLSLIYAKIYKDGPLKYEIETFYDNGKCKISYHR